MAKQRAQKSTAPDEPQASRLERTLAFMVFSSIGLSILCFLAVIVGTWLKFVEPNAVIWQVIIVLPLIGLPVGFALIITLIIVNAVRRSRANRASS